MAGERGGDLTGRVYARLFAARPDLEALFGPDANDAVKGEMLAQVFDTILDYIGDRVFAEHLMRSHGLAHGVPRDVFLGFFGVLAAVVAEVLDADWDGEVEAAWAVLLREIEGILAPSPSYP